MSDTARLCELLQTQAQLLRVRIAAEAGIKEYEADWLPEAKQVMRDATGKFAKKGATVDVPQQPTPVQPGMQMPQLQVPQVSIPQPQQIQQQVQNVTQNVNQEAQELKREIVSKLLAIREQAQNPEQVKENVQKAVEQKVEDVKTDIAEKKLEVSSELVELASKGLDKLVETNPEFTDKLLDLMFGVDAQEARDRLADMWEELHPELPNAIKPDPYKELAEDLMNLRGGDPKELGKDLLRAFNKVGYDYNKMLDDLNNMPDKPPFVQVMGKAAAMTIPIAMFLGATLAPEIGIGMFMGDNLAIILTNAAVGQFWSFAANKVMDKAEVDNPIARIGVDLLVGTAATSGALDVRGIYRLGFHRSAKIAESRVDDFIANFDNYVRENIVSGKAIEKIELKKNNVLRDLDESNHIVFTLGGAGDTDKAQSKLIALTLNRSKDQEIEKTVFFPFVDRKIFAPDLTKEDTELIALGKAGREYFKATMKNFHNEDAISLAVQVAALKKKYPEKEVTLMGYCGGGLIAREASEILKIMGVKTKNNITIASPFAGMTSAQDFTNILSENDVYLNFLRPRNNLYLNTVTDHMEYFEDPFLKKMLARILGDQNVETKDLKLYNEFTKITEEMSTGYIYKKFNLAFDDLKEVGLNFFKKQRKINSDDYIEIVKKMDGESVDIYKKREQVKIGLNEMEYELMKNQESDKEVLSLFLKLRKNYEEGIDTFLANIYRERYLGLDIQVLLKNNIKEVDLDSVLGKQNIDNHKQEIQSIKDYLKKIEDIISDQGEESSLSFATYTKNKLKKSLAIKEYNLDLAIKNAESKIKRK
jgi:hypothetical protein